MATTHQETTRILRRLLASGMTVRAERLLGRMRPADRGPVLSALTPVEIRTVVDLLFEGHRAASTLIELPPELLPQVFDALGDERLAQILSRLELDDMVEFVEWLDPERRDPIVSLLPEGAREELRKSELYPPDSAGRVMTTRFVALDKNMTAEEAIERIRATGAADDEAILYLYVIDDKSHLLGVVPLRRLVAASPERRCAEMMVTEPVSVPATADQEEVAQLVGRYNLLAVPVVDDEQRILGVITVDDVIEVINEEATEDMYLMAGLSDEDRVFSPAHHAIRKRLPYMLINLCALFLAAWVVGLFERTLEQVVALAFFMPLVAGMGGNGGIQSLTVITRAIALGELEFSSGVRAIAKEVSVAVVIGVVTGAISGLLAYMWQGSPYLGAILFVTMMATMAVAGVLGAAVPLILKALGQDPAVGSGVFVTTLTDIFGFVAFLGLGTMMLDRLA
ncbi:MAG: magnesium transporter [bacterium]|nr:magnesium transporter [bacterium]